MPEFEYCFNCGRQVPQDIDKLLGKIVDKLTKDDDKNPSWLQVNDWINFYLSPEKLRTEDNPGECFIWLCSKCKQDLKIFLNKQESKAEANV